MKVIRLGFMGGWGGVTSGTETAGVSMDAGSGVAGTAVQAARMHKVNSKPMILTGDFKVLIEHSFPDDPILLFRK
jgi:hypothetical protein